MNEAQQRPVRARTLPTDRIAYSAIAERPRLELPGGARMALWVIVNVEEWDILSPMPRTVLTPPAGGAPSPDIPNWAWHEYGNRVGFWRMLKVFDDFRVTANIRRNPAALRPATYAHNWPTITHSQTQLTLELTH